MKEDVTKDETRRVNMTIVQVEPFDFGLENNQIVNAITKFNNNKN